MADAPKSRQILAQEKIHIICQPMGAAMENFQ
jgi:hypothetical protein